VSPRRWVYGLLCVFNLALRFAWTLSVFGGLPGRGGGMFFMQVVEVARRTVWAVFRIEWEVVVKVHHSPEAYESVALRSLGVADSDSSEELAPSPPDTR
jgi:hypothetical protein